MPPMPASKNVGRLDVWLLVIILSLTTLGIVEVFDASYHYAAIHKLSETKYVRLQASWAVVGIVSLVCAIFVPYWKWKRFANLLMLVAVIALGLVLSHQFGILKNGARRWLGYKGYLLQPSEFAKFAIILFIARQCVGIRNMRHTLMAPAPCIVAIGLLTFLIVREPDLGTAALVAGTGLSTLFFAGLKRKYIVIAVVIALLVGGCFAFKGFGRHSGYQSNRIMVWLSPGKFKQAEGYQIYHSTLALETGGVFGQGIGLSQEKKNLPEAFTDCIFAVIGEEGGLVATLSLLLLYFLLVSRGVHIACATQDRFGSLVAGGISCSIGFQAALNVAAVTGSLPATGVPLPFISYGGTSLVLTMFMAGILLNVGRFPEGNPARRQIDGTGKAEKDFDRRHGGSASHDYPDNLRTKKPIRSARSSF